MKYATFSLASDVVPRLGAVRGDRMIDTAMLPATDWRPPTSLLDLVQQGPEAWRRMRDLVDRAPAGIGHPLARFAGTRRFRGRRRTCSAWAATMSRTRRKRARAGTGSEDPDHPGDLHEGADHRDRPLRRHPGRSRVTQQVDWEVELGAVIGKTGRDIRRATR